MQVFVRYLHVSNAAGHFTNVISDLNQLVFWWFLVVVWSQFTSSSQRWTSKWTTGVVHHKAVTLFWFFEPTKLIFWPRYVENSSVNVLYLITINYESHDSLNDSLYLSFKKKKKKSSMHQWILSVIFISVRNMKYLATEFTLGLCLLWFDWPSQPFSQWRERKYILKM